jgi:hypothetical protein
VRQLTMAKYRYGSIRIAFATSALYPVQPQHLFDSLAR